MDGMFFPKVPGRFIWSMGGVTLDSGASMHGSRGEEERVSGWAGIRIEEGRATQIQEFLIKVGEKSGNCTYFAEKHDMIYTFKQNIFMF